MNTGRLVKDWDLKKEATLAQLFKEESQRHLFAKSYEKGLENIGTSIENNLQFLLMLPEVYHFNHYYDPYHPSVTTSNKYRSQFINGMFLEYCFSQAGFNNNADHVFLRLESDLKNEYFITANFLNSYYAKFSKDGTKDYGFKIKLYYDIDRHTGKVIKAQLALNEQLNHSRYRVNIKLEECDMPIKKQAAKKSQNYSTKNAEATIGNTSKGGWSVFDGLEDQFE